MAYKETNHRAVVGVVSAVNGLVIPIPAGNAGIIKLLATKDNADVVSAKRTKQLLAGEVSPQDMTEVVDGVTSDRGLAAQLANQIDTEALAADSFGDATRDALQEPKKSTKRKTAAQRAAEAAAVAAVTGDALADEAVAE